MASKEYAEYIVKLSADTSNLESYLGKVNGSLKHLQDDEVLIKLDYDGNIKKFNQVFDQILKMHPELSIQFQYDANEKILNKELDKLKTLEEIKIDIDSGNANKSIDTLIDNLKKGVNEDIGKGVAENLIKGIYKRANTIKAAGGQIGLDLSEKIYDVLKGTKYEEIFNKLDDSINLDKIKLFNFSGKIEDEIKNSKTKIDDLKKYMRNLEDAGAIKGGRGSGDGTGTGSSKEIKQLQDDIRIINIHIEELKEQTKGVSGEAFKKMAEEVAELNDQLQISLNKLSGFSEADDKINAVVKTWRKQDITKTNERYTAFNSKTMKTSGVHAAANVGGVAEDLINTAIKEMAGEADGFIHSHPERFAAFSDNDLDAYFKLASEGITRQIVISTEEALHLDMSKVNLDMKDEILSHIRDRYDAIENEEIFEQPIYKFIDKLKVEAENVFSNLNNSQIPADIVNNFRTRYNKIFALLKEDSTIDDYYNLVDEAIKESLKESSSYNNASVDVKKNLRTQLLNLTPDLQSSLNQYLKDYMQKAFQEELMDVFSNPKYLLEGVSSAIALQSISEFENSKELIQIGQVIGEAVIKGVRKGLDAHSDSKESVKAVDDEVNGIVHEIDSRLDDVEKAGERQGEALVEGLIKETREELEKEKKNLNVLDSLINGNAKYSGKKEATEALRYYNNLLLEQEENGKLNDKTVVAYNNIRKKAEELGVAQSTLDRYFNAGAIGGYQNALDHLNNSYNVTQNIVESLEKKLADLYEQESKDIIDENNLSSGTEEAVESQNQIQSELEETAEKAEKASKEIQTFYRGVKHSDELWSSDGGWFSSKQEVSEGYGANIFKGQIDTSSDKIYKIDALGAIKNEITWLGDGTDETSKRMIYLRDRISEVEKEIRNIEDNHSTNGWIDNEYEDEFNNLKTELSGIRKEYNELDKSKDNIYGTHDIKWFRDQSKALGYSGLLIKNVKDLNESKAELLSEGDNAIADSLAIFDEKLVDNIQQVAVATYELADAKKEVSRQSNETPASSELEKAKNNIIEFKKATEDASNSDIRSGYEKMQDEISELGEEYKKSEKYCTELLEAIQEVQELNGKSILYKDDDEKLTDYYNKFPEINDFFKQFPEDIQFGNDDFIDHWFEFMETIPKAQEFLKFQDTLSDFVDFDERVNSSSIIYLNEELNKLNNQLQEITGKEINFIEKYKEISNLLSAGDMTYYDALGKILEKEFPTYNVFRDEDFGTFKLLPKSKKELNEIKQQLGLVDSEVKQINEDAEIAVNNIINFNDRIKAKNEPSNLSPIISADYEEAVPGVRNYQEALDELVQTEKETNKIIPKPSADYESEIPQVRNYAEALEEIRLEEEKLSKIKSNPYKTPQDIKELKDLYQELRMINNDIQVYENPENYVSDGKDGKLFNGYGLKKTRSGYEDLKILKEQILKAAPLLQGLADSTKRFSAKDFVQMFAADFGQEMPFVAKKAEDLKDVLDLYHELVNVNQRLAEVNPDSHLAKRFEEYKQSILELNPYLSEYSDHVKEIITPVEWQAKSNDILGIKEETQSIIEQVDTLDKLVKGRKKVVASKPKTSFTEETKEENKELINQEKILEQVSVEQKKVNETKQENQASQIKAENQVLEKQKNIIESFDVSTLKTFTTQGKSIEELIQVYKELNRLKAGEKDKAGNVITEQDIQTANQLKVVLKDIFKENGFDGKNGLPLFNIRVVEAQYEEFKKNMRITNAEIQNQNELKEAAAETNTILKEQQNIKELDKPSQLTPRNNQEIEKIKEEIQLEEKLGETVEQTEKKKATVKKRTKVSAKKPIEEETKALEQQETQAAETREELEKLNETQGEQPQDQPFTPLGSTRTEEEIEALSRLNPILDEIIGKINDKTKAFIRERETVEGEVQREVTDLEQLDGQLLLVKDTVEKLANYMGNIDIDATSISEFMKQVKGLNNIKTDKLGDISKAIKDFSKEVKNIKINDSSLIKAIDNIVSKGDEIKALANVIKAGTEAINNAEKVVTNNTSETTNEPDKSLVSSVEKANAEAVKRTNALYKEQESNLLKIRDLHIKNQTIDTSTAVGAEKKKQNLEEISLLLKRNNDIQEEIQASEAVNYTQEEKLKQIIADTNRELQNRQAILDAQDQDNFNKNFSKAQETIQGLIDKLKAFSDSGKFTEGFTNKINNKTSEFQEELKQLDEITSIDKLEEKLKQLQESFNEIKLGTKLKDNIQVGEISLAKLEERIAKVISKNSKMGEEFKSKYEALITELRNTDNMTDFSNIVAQFSKLNAEIENTNRTGQSFFDQFVHRLTDMNAKFFAQYLSFNDWIRYIQQAFNTIRGLDTALVDLRKTTTMSSADLKEFYRDSNDVAKQMGVTTQEIINQASAWSRLNKIGLLYGNI